VGARRILIEEGCHGGKQQNLAVARVRAHRLFGLGQKPDSRSGSAKAARRTSFHSAATSC
jgi:hypothetical protein